MNKKEHILDKLMYYIGFLNTFIENAENLLKVDDIQRFRMLREYIIDARKLIKKDS